MAAINTLRATFFSWEHLNSEKGCFWLSKKHSVHKSQRGCKGTPLGSPTTVNALVKLIIEFNKNLYAKFTYCFRGFTLFATESFDKTVELLMTVTMNDDNEYEMFISRIRMFSRLRTGKRVLKA